MTINEQRSLDQLSVFIHEWRMEDKEWKANVSARLKKLEDDKIARDAIAVERQQTWAKNTWKLIGLAGFLSTTLAGLTVAVMRFFFHL